MENEKAKEVVADCARLREEAKQRTYTVAQAIDAAEWLAKTPDGLLTPDAARQVIAALHGALQSSPCFYKAAKLGLPSFTFLAYDRAGHAAIRFWARLAEEQGASREKFASALAMVLQWERRTDLRWPT